MCGYLCTLCVQCAQVFTGMQTDNIGNRAINKIIPLTSFINRHHVIIVHSKSIDVTPKVSMQGL